MRRIDLTIEEAIAWIHSRKKFGSRPGLARIQALLTKLDNPEKKVPAIHIAGTNGKGSTVAYLRSILLEAGVTVGSFTSPYIEEFNERIAIDGKSITDVELIHYVKKFQPIVAELDQDPAINGITEFEILTAMMLDYFAAEKVDVAIIEVGLGGLLDSTNVVQPILTAITTIGYDHMDILGDTLNEIAYQKAGIIKRNIPVVTGNITKGPLIEIIEKAAAETAKIYRYGEEYQVDYLRPDPTWGELFNFTDRRGKLSSLKVPLLGRHQVENAGVAIELFHLYCEQFGLPFEEKTIQKGLAKAQWPARMEKISNEPLIVMDGAHNGHAIERLVENIKREFSGYNIKILFSALETKDVDQMLTLLSTIPRVKIYLTTFEYPKALDLSRFDKLDSRFEVVSLWQFGLGELLENMQADDLLLITGSLYFVSEVRQLLLNLGGTNEER
ncbi:bifunctional folylpolyglutamate synthase/dihydrofolate synthase [Enterococcus dongliensis]|uniref:tetrahydrofolate synthase n=1 Tax=Enterococcus dongliensis TaxID=2559925 RepID=A0AAW8TGI5_9ENTE|nr:folylpolyglutamate synthase/dihydrofolate synthase family protein [Enterococcus dongliensis]MDT2596605.1 bifunctional folylpolyglutamate synthase/dihydrofolate synthase [Enterococcus dongliensis]MDT2603663.1 bifunctional folylpolyglutamate synthase/dihydrofolate synthase [Enterococcus dongliensis]MDT2634409.1 bifunctional folylpolyglutamate synthase/dihydrofolate synthase [Enterococcus dongliensis]MDT2637399.1 bifunctional folylpolyglutamate synthase/dihydrofolate synthase [Enterococcus dong